MTEQEFPNLPPFCPYKDSQKLEREWRQGDVVCQRPETCAKCISDHIDVNTDPIRQNIHPEGG